MATKIVTPAPPISERGIPRNASLHDYDTGAVSDRTGTWNDGEGVQVQQHMRDEVDINTIMHRFMGSGMLPQLREGVYADFSGVEDYWSALERVEQVDRNFMDLSAEVRERFDNDPGKLWEYIQNHTQAEFEAYVAPEAPSSEETPPEAT